MKKSLVVDAQIFQTPDANRGMALYTRSLLNAVLSQEHFDEVTFIANQGLPEVSVDITKLAAQHHTTSKVVTLELEYLKSSVQPVKALKHNKKALTHYVAANLDGAEVFFLIPSFFVAGIYPAFPEGPQVRKLLLFHDLIPLLFYNRYKNSWNYADYLARYPLIFEADKIFTNSETVFNDIVVNLGINSEHVSYIGGAAADRSALTSSRPQKAPTKKFILMPSGNDPRKNNHNAIQAFEVFRKNSKEDYLLVITSHFDRKTIAELSELSPNIVFAGSVTNEEMLWFFTNAQAVFFPSLYEGLGMPLLEGVESARPIACSNIDVFREIHQTAFNFFNPEDVQDMAAKLQQTVETSAVDNKAYTAILKHFNWRKAGERFTRNLPAQPTQPRSKKRCAVFTPVPSGYSAIGKVVQLLHPALSQNFDIDYYFDVGSKPAESRPNYLPYLSSCYDASEFSAKRYAEYDTVIYNLGNSEYHTNTITQALCYPGIAIFHDTHLTGIFDLLQNEGYISQERRDVENTLTDMANTSRSSCITSLANAQLGVLVHSKYAQKAVEEVSVNKFALAYANLPVTSPGYFHEATHEVFRVGFAGVLTADKGLQLIEKLEQDTRTAGIAIEVFGFTTDKKVITWLRSKGITLRTDVSDFEYQCLLRRMDVLVNYRESYHGETSLTCLEAMRFGVPVIVKSGQGWFGELPSTAVLKAKTAEQVIDLVFGLYDKQIAASGYAEKSRKLVRDSFGYQQYVATLTELSAAPSVNRALAEMMKQAPAKQEVLQEITEGA